MQGVRTHSVSGSLHSRFSCDFCPDPGTMAVRSSGGPHQGPHGASSKQSKDGTKGVKLKDHAEVEGCRESRTTRSEVSKSGAKAALD